MTAANDGIEFAHDGDGPFGSGTGQASFDAGQTPARRIGNTELIKFLLNFSRSLCFFISEFRFCEDGFPKGNHFFIAFVNCFADLFFQFFFGHTVKPPCMQIIRPGPDYLVRIR